MLNIYIPNRWVVANIAKSKLAASAAGTSEMVFKTKMSGRKRGQDLLRKAVLYNQAIKANNAIQSTNVSSSDDEESFDLAPVPDIDTLSVVINYDYEAIIYSVFKDMSRYEFESLNSLFLCILPEKSRNLFFATEELASSALCQTLERIINLDFLYNRIQKNRDKIVNYLFGLGKIVVFPRNKEHYDLVVVLINQDTDIASMVSAIANFHLIEITYSRTVILHGNSNQCLIMVNRLIQYFSIDYPDILGGVEAIGFEYDVNSDVIAQKIMNDIGSGCESILLVSEYGVLNSLRRFMQNDKNYLNKIDFFCGERQEDIMPSNVFISQTVIDVLINPVMDCVRRNATGLER